MPKKVTTESFIEKAKLIHGDKYDYSLVEYKGDKEKIKIICKKHGEFEQTPGSHSQGRGCNKCGEKRTSKSHRLTTKTFISKSESIHENIYDYYKTRYKSSLDKVLITCKIHGDFSQKADKHIQGQGCTKCKNSKTSIRMQHNNPGWTYANWQKAGEKSKNFDSYKVYIIRCWNEDEKFYKIGKTFLKIKKRFDHEKTMPYSYEVIKTFKGNAIETSKLERDLQRKHKAFKYVPKIKFEGLTECFSKTTVNG